MRARVIWGKEGEILKESLAENHEMRTSVKWTEFRKE
jgi:hypothetical protein